MTGKEGKKKSECVRCEINLSSEGDILVLNFSAVRSICVGHLCAHTCTSCPVHCETTSVLCTFYKKPQVHSLPSSVRMHVHLFSLGTMQIYFKIL